MKNVAYVPKGYASAVTAAIQREIRFLDGMTDEQKRIFLDDSEPSAFVMVRSRWPHSGGAGSDPVRSNSEGVSPAARRPETAAPQQRDVA